MKKIRENKNIIVRIRVTDAENAHLMELATQSYLNISDYIRRRLFDEGFVAPTGPEPDNKSKFACDHDRELMKLNMRIFTLVKEMGRLSLPNDKYRHCHDLAAKALQEWGYE